MKRVYILLVILFIFFFKTVASFAIEDPLGIPNNKFGIHILFPEELRQAAKLVNSNNGNWGYVTIPIQAGDRAMEKWQKFMDEAKTFHVIPILRLATEGDYFNTKVWRKPTSDDVLDFANFLNSLQWPVKNRYVVVFNEVNRSDEWGGKLDPIEYAKILNYTISVFKSLSPDFFIISSGLDNAAPNITGEYMNEYDYMVAMNDAVPGIFNQIDGLGSHSYPNPGFKQMPYILTSQSIYSFNFENNLAFRLSSKNLPIFITETGWSKDILSETQIAEYFKYAFQYVWADRNIVAVNIFLLQAGWKPFSQFSLINDDGRYNFIFQTLSDMSKTKGEPTASFNQHPSPELVPKNIPLKTFPKIDQYKNMSLEKTNFFENFIRWFLKLFM